MFSNATMSSVNFLQTSSLESEFVTLETDLLCNFSLEVRRKSLKVLNVMLD
jgi:hypothetical protein